MISEVKRHKVQPALKGHPNIKNIIAVGSGKGGVGKSTVTTNLALALVKLGATVGILDADIYGPSQPMLMGNHSKPTSKDKKTIQPIEVHGIQMMSIGNLVDLDEPMIWRGPMVSGALMQLLGDTQWDKLDYLLIDLPPGTGDIQLTMSKKIPIAGAVVVTTPQDLALLDAKRACQMFEKVHIHVLGVVENMSYYQCKKCGDIAHIFGEQGGEKLAKRISAPILGHVPLDIRIREASDLGVPIIAFDAASNQSDFSDLSGCYVQLAQNIHDQLSTRPKDYDINIPSVKVK